LSDASALASRSKRAMRVGSLREAAAGGGWTVLKEEPKEPKAKALQAHVERV
jgi:hypothetical protein